MEKSRQVDFFTTDKQLWGLLKNLCKEIEKGFQKFSMIWQAGSRSDGVATTGHNGDCTQLPEQRSHQGQLGPVPAIHH